MHATRTDRARIRPARLYTHSVSNGIHDPSWNTITRVSASNYLVLQGLCGLLWWACLGMFPQAAAWFLPGVLQPQLAGALAYPDLTLFAIGSMVAAFVCRKFERSAPTASALLLGAVAYATLLSLGFSINFGQGWLGTMMMLGACAATGLCVILCCCPKSVARLFREARESEIPLGLRTAAQAALFWITFLAVVPVPLSMLERLPELEDLNRASMHFFGQSGLRAAFVGTPIFIAASALGITSSVSLVRAGGGTPLPLASPVRLVVSGPYRIVRNPMAVAGILQGIAVAIMLRSLVVLAYAVLGAIVWHVLVRPIEEHDMRHRFGAPFDEYRARVRCWLPTFPRKA